MEISFNKVKALAEAMGEGAAVFVNEQGLVTLRTNRLFTADMDPDAPMPELTIYNKLSVSYDDALKLVKELKPFTLTAGGMYGEYDEHAGIYAITTRKGTKEEPEYQQFAAYEKNRDRWHLLSEDDFKKVKGTSTNKRHYDWVRDSVIPVPDTYYGYTEAEFEL